MNHPFYWAVSSDQRTLGAKCEAGGGEWISLILVARDDLPEGVAG
ncbi:hypothetical protein [Bacillus inaquosorum]|nr:hypothetical protein [Bacillus inaquosorum]